MDCPAKSDFILFLPNENRLISSVARSSQSPRSIAIAIPYASSCRKPEKRQPSSRIRLCKSKIIWKRRSTIALAIARHFIYSKSTAKFV